MKKLVGVGLVALLVGGVVSYFSFAAKPQNEVVIGGYPYANSFSFGTASTTSVTTGDNVVLATSTIREYVRITNVGGDVIFLNFGKDAVAGRGVVLTPSSTIVISPQGETFTKQAIHAITSAGVSALNLFFTHTAQ